MVDRRMNDDEASRARARAVQLIAPPELHTDLEPTARALEAQGWAVTVSQGRRDRDAVGMLAAGVAHQFNNTLSVILGNLDLILAEVSPADPLYPRLDQIRTSGQAAAEMTRQLLALSGQQFLHPRPVDLNQLVAGIDPVVRKLAGERVRVTAVPAPGRPQVFVDPVQIEQVILTLAANAREAMPDGGDLTLEVLDGDATHAALAVSDTGVGMSPEVQERVFEPYFTTKSREAGDGLGLPTARGIVEQTGGFIRLASAPGRGTRFEISLPRARAEAVSAQAAAEPAATGGHGCETILLVEDDDRVRAVVRTMLSRQGYRVLEAANAGEALLILEQRKDEIALLLTDVVMPRLSGRKLADRATIIRPDLKVIYMSGYNDEFVFGHGVLPPGTAFLPKPVRSDALARKLREVLDG
jgi:two-component system cell cycle sensor histidine kinase/response regulator CckA